MEISINQLKDDIYALEKSIAAAPTPEDIHDLNIKKARLECYYCRKNGAGVCQVKRHGYICPVKKKLEGGRNNEA
jgi:hypothetical protein